MSAFCCSMREHFVLGIVAQRREGPAPVDVMDFVDLEKQTDYGRPVIRIKFCPFCGKAVDGPVQVQLEDGLARAKELLIQRSIQADELLKERDEALASLKAVIEQQNDPRRLAFVKARYDVVQAAVLVGECHSCLRDGHGDTKLLALSDAVRALRVLQEGA